MCEVTADGDIIIGRVRPKNNPLIRRAVVGKPAFHNDLPPLSEDHTFGAPLKRDAEGAGDVMLSWSNGTRTKSNPTAAEILNKHRSRGFVADTDRVYGAKSGDSANMADLMRNRFELEWVREQRSRQDAHQRASERERRRKAAPTRISVERNARMREHTAVAAKPHPKEYFTLSQFQHVPSRYQTPTPTGMAKGYFSPATHTTVDCSAHRNTSQTPTEDPHGHNNDHGSDVGSN